MALGIWNVTRVHRWPLEQGGTAQDGGGGVWRGIFNHSGLGQACGGGLLVLSTQLGGVAVYSNLGSILPLSGELFSHWSANIQPNARQYIRAHGFWSAVQDVFLTLGLLILTHHAISPQPSLQHIGSMKPSKRENNYAQRIL